MGIAAPTVEIKSWYTSGVEMRHYPTHRRALVPGWLLAVTGPRRCTGDRAGPSARAQHQVGMRSLGGESRGRQRGRRRHDA